MSLQSQDRTGRQGRHHRSLFSTLLNLLFPPRCVSCGAGESWLCAACTDQILFYEPPWPQMLDQIWPLEDVRSAAHLVGPLRQAIHAFKYQGLRALAVQLGQVLYDCWDAEPWPADVIAPVPLHATRQRERGYNQSALLARELSRHTGLPVIEGVLLRTVATLPQVGMNAAERSANVRGAFTCQDDSLGGQQVLLIDDVLTTGATIRACAEALLQGHAGGVWAMTLAHD